MAMLARASLHRLTWWLERNSDQTDAALVRDLAALSGKAHVQLAHQPNGSGFGVPTCKGRSAVRSRRPGCADACDVMEWMRLGFDWAPDPWTPVREFGCIIPLCAAIYGCNLCGVGASSVSKSRSSIMSFRALLDLEPVRCIPPHVPLGDAGD